MLIEGYFIIGRLRMDICSAFLANALGAKKTQVGPKLPKPVFPISNPLMDVSVFGNKFSQEPANPLETNILNLQKAADMDGDGETTDVEVQEYLLKNADKDKDGKITLSEYDDYLQKAMDADKDGKVSEEERIFFENQMADLDGDGVATQDEKINYLRNYLEASILENSVEIKSSATVPTVAATSGASSTPAASTSAATGAAKVSTAQSNVTETDVSKLDTTKAGAALNKLLDKNGKGGVLQGKGELIAKIAKEYDIPVNIFAAIIFAETGWGKSNAIKKYNNPGGVMDPSKGCKTLQHLSTLEEGLRVTARNLKNNYFDKGLDTIAKIQPKYCPVGAANDPKGLNKNWLRTVTSISNKIVAMC